MPMTSRERVLTALDHKQPDRVPLDLGATQTGISVESYDKLKRLLGISTETRVSNVIMQLAEVEEDVLQRFQIDFRHLLPQPPSTWTLKIEPDNSFLDEWGCKWRRPPGSHYYDLARSPLAMATIDDLANFPWPDPDDPGRVSGMTERLEYLRDHTGCALEAGLLGPYETCWMLRGLEQWFYDMMVDPEFASALFDRVVDVLEGMHTRFLEVAGPYLDVVMLWDDFGCQDNLLISPKLFRDLIKPREARLIAAIKSRTNARMAIHSCGAVYSILPDFVEIGIEIINPVQVSAVGMDPVRLKKHFGQALSFWGGIDTQHTLPFGTPLEVASEVRQRVAQLGRDGGYILASVHNIQADVPPGNVIAMFDAALEYGR